MSIVSTGNILNVTKKAGQKPIEELIDCLKATFDDSETVRQEVRLGGEKLSRDVEVVTRSKDDLLAKIEEHERNNVKIGAKIFLNRKSTENLKYALENLLQTVLKVGHLDNLILAYHPTGHENGTTNGNVENGNSINGNGEAAKEGVLEWGVGHASALDELKELWKVLEEYANEKKITQLGIADLDSASLKDLYESASIRPTIAQINLSACCVVPPSLQEFCTSNDIQLLTHSDPEEILNRSAMESLSGKPLEPLWTIRYQVHVKCRGVLTAKGFVVGVENH